MDTTPLASTAAKGGNSSTDCPILREYLVPLTAVNGCSLIDRNLSLVLSTLSYIFSPVGILINLFQIIYMLRSSRAWTTIRMHMLNLTFVNIISLLAYLPWAMYVNTQYNWQLGKAMCICTNFVYYLAETAYLLFTSALSIFTYKAALQPMTYINLQTEQSAVFFTILMWILAIAVAVIGGSNTLYVSMDGQFYCGGIVISNTTPLSSLGSLIHLFSLQLLIPFLVVIPCYIKIIATLFLSNKRTPPGNRNNWLKPQAAEITSFLLFWVFGQLFLILYFIIYLTTINCSNVCFWAKLINNVNEVALFLSALNVCLCPLTYKLYNRAFHCFSS
ncbi:probable G-protein coupled receptor 34 [Scyliorhinus canicula]|uniref:probable G-protein coupled receptor 34 n=1 Tax=Scyliorhinus canicula TaxID=7830 RepID=UPI0018F5F4AA|nr:probable G-protein coupled receptor 34 [Scyliorhinus canicula]